MIHMEEANLSLLMLARVRNKALDAYHEVMRMSF
jgi:flagellar hook-basal body complex protein FliE